MFCRTLSSILIIFASFNNYYSLKLKFEALSLIALSKAPKVDDLMEHLIVEGPHNLLAELLDFQSVDFRKIAHGKCMYMTTSTILDIIEEYERGELTSEQYKTVLSADCAAKWTTDLFGELTRLKLLKRIPVNFYESKELNVNRMYPEIALAFLNLAFKGLENRHKIIWNRWSNRVGYVNAKGIFHSQLWNCTISGFSPHLWQSISFRNFASIRESDMMGRIFLVNLIGLKGQKLKHYNQPLELVQRFYTLLSFIKLSEIDYSNAFVSGNGDPLTREFLKRVTKDTVILGVKLQERIKELDEETSIRLGKLFEFILIPFDEKESNKQVLNGFFLDFLTRDSENVQLGDWLLSILCILSDDIDQITPENIYKFLMKFISLLPSLDSIVFALKFLKEKWMSPVIIEHFFYKLLKDKPKYLIEFYRTNSSVMPRKLIPLIPLRMRVITNLKNRIIPFPGGKAVLEFNFLADPKASNMKKFLEMVKVISWNKLGINNPAIYKTSFVGGDDESFEMIPVGKIVQIYLELFLTQEEFYEISRRDERSRPILRILPVFPVQLWHQLAHVLTRAVLLKIEIPFVIDLEFFRGCIKKENSVPVLIEMNAKIETSVDDKLREFYGFLTENIKLTPLNLKSKLEEFYAKFKKLKIKRKFYRRSRHSILRSVRSVDSFELHNPSITTLAARRHSIDLPITFGNTHAYEMLSFGFDSFLTGLKPGFNLDDFSVEEAHKLIFYRK